MKTKPYIGAPNVECASPTPFSNWFYRWAELFLEDGTSTCTASHASTIRTKESWDEYAVENTGKEVGFGAHPELLVTEVIIHEFEFKPCKTRIKLKPDAASLLMQKWKEECDSAWYSSRHTGFTRGQRRVIDWLRDNKEREFQVTSTPPQWSTQQFWSTMPEPDSEGGFVFAKGICDKIKP